MTKEQVAREAALWFLEYTEFLWQGAHPFLRRARLAAKTRALINHDRFLNFEINSRGMVKPPSF